MTKVVQWYIKPDPFKEEHQNKLIPISNYAPWRSIKDLSKSRLERMYHNFKMTNKHGLLNKRSFPILNDYITWADRIEETQIKYIDRDEYDKRDINIFPIQFRQQEDQIFSDPSWWPLAKLPDIAIDFLKLHANCYILFHDIFEGKAMSGYNWTQIPSMMCQRKLHDFKNPVMYINCQTNAEIHYDTKCHVIPSWLMIGGSHHWIEYPYYSDLHGFVDTENVDELLEAPNFNKGRFLFYGGRFRVGRMYLFSHLLELLPKEQFYYSANGNEFLKIRDTESVDSIIDGVMNALEKRNILSKNGLTTPYDDRDKQRLKKMLINLPVKNFPKELLEESAYYDKNNKYIYAPNPDHYKNIFVDLSCETMNDRTGEYHNYILFSEKIAKPLRACRPFICSANAGFYKELRKLGFKTFDRWWDESFDEDVDIKEHTRRILKVVKEINSWSNEKCAQVFEEMKPTLLHNRKQLDYIVKEAPRSWLETVKRLDKEWHNKPEPKR